MSDQKTGTFRVCPRCGFIDPFGTETNCLYCQFALISVGHSFFDIAFNGFSKDKTVPTMEEIETKYVKNSPYFCQELWDKRKKQEAENHQKAEEQKTSKAKKFSLSKMSICQTCGCLYKGKPASCDYCKSSQLAEVDITGAAWDAMPVKERQNKKREILVEYCYKYKEFDREKWKQRILADETSLEIEFERTLYRNPDLHTEDFDDYLFTDGKKCPVCGSDQIQVAGRYGWIRIRIKMICLKCKKTF